MATATAMWLRAPIRAPRPLPRLLPADDSPAEPASASRGVAKRRRVGDDDGGAYTDDAAEAGVSSRATSTTAVSSNPFTIAAGAAKPPASPRARRRLAAPPRLERGDYVLPDGASFLRYEPGALAAQCTREAYDELWAVSRDVPPTPNPLNRHTRIKRKQGTFGAAYAFGAQKSARLDGPNGALGARFANERDWPSLVRLCVEDARRRVDARGAAADAFGPLRAAAHVNWYPDGTAGMGRHSDAEPSLVRGAPIFSYSFLSGGEESPARVFDLYEKQGVPASAAQRPFAAVPLAHGDACVMAGAFQDAYEHGVRATAAKAHAGHSRINVTVRALSRADDGDDRQTIL